MQQKMDSILGKLANHKVVPVIQIERIDDALPLAEALIENGLPLAEITLRTDAALPVLALLAEKVPELMLIAGTVLSPQMAEDAMSAGAQLVVSPGFNPTTVSYCCERSIPIMPGVMTPGEIERALMLGVNAVKFFPAAAAGGVAMLKALSAPFKDLKIMPTGGINAGNICSYLALPQVICCGGSWMVAPQWINEKNWQAIGKSVREAVALVGNSHS